MGEIMSRSVERTANDAAAVEGVLEPRLRALFKDFAAVEILQRQLLAEGSPGSALDVARQRALAGLEPDHQSGQS